MVSFAIRELPPELRPRERLEQHGSESLSIAELLAIILGSGTSGSSVLAVSQEMLVRFGSLERLLEASLAELMEIKGIGRAKALQLKAVFAIALKCQSGCPPDKPKIATPAHAFALARPEFFQEKQEAMLVMLRDVRGCLIHKEKIARGTLSELLVHPREVFFPAVRYKAHSLILAHNHPSGDPTPSEADLELTRHLLLASRTMGMPLDDHLILGTKTFTSLRDQGFIPSRIRY